MDGILNGVRVIGEYIFWFFAVAVAASGAVLLIEQAVWDLFSTHVGVLEPWVSLISNYLAVLSLVFICFSIYIEHFPRTAPAWISRYFLAPLFIGVAIVLLAVQVYSGQLAIKYLSGVSLLALGGALLRVRGFPLEITTGPNNRNRNRTNL